MPATDIASSIRNRHLSVQEVAEYFLDRIEHVNPSLNAFVHFDRGQVFREATRLQKAVDAGGTLGPLHGVPYSLKEATAIAGYPLTNGLKPLDGSTVDFDTSLVSRLKNAGGLFLGKTNMPESGYWGGGTENHLYGSTHNPWKRGYSAGGSSGGASAAIAAGLGPLAEGSDGAGSIRIPAAMCGVYGFKPSIGRIPQEFLPGRHEAWIFHGPITRTVADAAVMMDVMSGPSSLDPLSLPNDGTNFLESIQGDVKGLRVAWSPNLGLGENYVDSEVLTICEQAVQSFEELGATVEEVTFDWTDAEDAMWNGVWLPAYAQFMDVLDWENLTGQVDEQLIALIAESRTTTGETRSHADQARGALYRSFATQMENYDILVSPTLATAGFPIGNFAPDYLRGETLQRQILGWLLTYPFNMTGTPSASIPAGFTSDGLPVGLQISGKHLADTVVLRASANFESIRPWANIYPDLTQAASE